MNKTVPLHWKAGSNNWLLPKHENAMLGVAGQVIQLRVLQKPNSFIVRPLPGGPNCAL